MSNYTKLTDYAAKDSLLSGNPSKLVKGTEIGADFDAVSVAVATKYDDTIVVAATSKTTPVDADLIPIVDSAASNVLKKLTWANLKATLLTWLQGTVFPSPGAIGSTTPSTVAATTISASGGVNLGSGSPTTDRYSIAGQTFLSKIGTANYWWIGQDHGYVVKYDGSAVIADFTPTGLAVTGTLSASGTISGRTTNGQVLGASNGVDSDIGIYLATNHTQFVNTGTTSDFQFILNGATKATLSSTGLAVSGALSASSTSVSQVLTLRGGSGTDNCAVYFQGNSTAGNVFAIGTNVSTNGNGANFDFYDLIAGVNRARIDASGNLLVGSGGTSAANVKIAINGSSNAGNGAYFELQNNGSGFAAVGDYKALGGGGSTSLLLCKNSTGGVYLATSSATSWTAVSDETKKNILEPITSAVAKVSTLRAIIGTYKDDPNAERHPFLIAQDVQKVLPEAVADTGGVLGLSYTDTIPLLVAAINEQTVEIESLKAYKTQAETVIQDMLQRLAALESA